MNILHIRASNFYGGPERQIHQHARLAKDAGINIIVTSFAEGGKQPEYLATIAGDGVETYCFPVKSAYDLSAVQKLREFITRREASVLCTHDYRSNLIGYLAVRNSATPWVAFSRGHTSENVKVRFYQWLDRRVIKKATKVVAVSGGQRDWLISNGVRPEKIVVVHNAIDANLFAPIPAADLREQFGWQSDTVVGIAAGRFSHEKGQSFLIDAAAMIVKDLPQLRLILFGDGPDHAAMQKKVDNLMLSDKIILPGHKKGVIGEIKGADFVINPSLSEGLPNVVLEAMAVGTPVLATSVGGVPEIIDHQRTGLLVAPADAGALAEMIRFILNNRVEADILAKSALEFVTKSCSFKRQNELLCQLYQELAD